jgi:tetratricopeptide (TPR) repeat protein
LEYRLDENQRLDLRMSLNDAPTHGSFSWTVENPLSHVINPGNTRQKIDEVEEDIRIGKIPPPQQVEKFVELAEDYATLKQYEKAIEYLSTVLRVKNAPDAYVLNKIAIYYGNLGDYEREEKFYRVAARASSWTGPWFNLALLQQQRKKYPEAMESVNKSLVSESEAPYLVLRAQLHETLGHPEDRDRDLKAALDDFGPPADLSDWALGWLAKAARMAGDHEHEQAAREEQARRKKGEQQELAGGILPDMTGTLQRRS